MGLFTSSVMHVEPQWIDYNGHMNMAYYNVLFDRCADEIYEVLGFGPDYAKREKHTTYTAEFHVCYVRELHLDDLVRVTFQLIDADEKRFHSYQEIWHVDGWLAATAECLALHIDMKGPRVAPMLPGPAAAVQRLLAEHKSLPKPDRVGRSIGIRSKSAL